MKKASREMNLGDNWKAALARVKADFVPPGEQDELVAKIARESIAFVKQRDLVTVPPLCEESWGLTMISPETLQDNSLCGLQRSRNDGCLCQRRFEAGRQADGHGGEQPAFHATWSFRTS